MATTGLFYKWLIWKETWTLTIEDFDFNSDDHFEFHLSGTDCCDIHFYHLSRFILVKPFHTLYLLMHCSTMRSDLHTNEIELTYSLACDSLRSEYNNFQNPGPLSNSIINKSINILIKTAQSAVSENRAEPGSFWWCQPWNFGIVTLAEQNF